MKKYYILIFSLILLLCGCGGPQTDKSVLQEFVDELKFESITDDLDLKTEYEYKGEHIKASWESDDTDVLTNDGKITLYEETMYVNLKGTFKTESETIEKTFELIINGASIDDILIKCSKDIIIDKEVSSDISLPTKIKYGYIRINCAWTSSDENIIAKNGELFYPTNDTEITLKCKLSYDDSEYEASFKTLAKKLDETPYLNKLSELVIPNLIESDVELVDTITVGDESFNILWESSNNDAITNNGKVMYVDSDTKVSLKAKIQVKNRTIEKSFDTTVKAASGQLAINLALENITIPKIINNDILLPSKVNGVSITWKSNNTSAIADDGKINKSNKTYKSVTITATLKAGDLTQTHDYESQVGYEEHMFLDRTFEGEKSNTEIVDGKLVLTAGSLSGSYTTNVIEVPNFTECVGSYSATSSTTETCELKVRIRIGGKWTKYFTYGKFGKGLKNGYDNQTDTNAKMVEDEIKTTSGNADAFQLQLLINRSSATEKGPVVTLLALAINYVNNPFTVDISGIPNEVKHDVPKLYQHDVPSIGGSICSITSSTMLMMYRGYDFTGLADYPHQYMAGILKDYGHNIFGNWSYNAIGMGSFGATSYVKRFYSYQEILFHLYYVGPVSASIKGTMITDAKTYTTGGHLIVVTGYKIEGSKIYIYVNDPNIACVSTRCTLENFLNVNRMVSYIVE